MDRQTYAFWKIWTEECATLEGVLGVAVHVIVKAESWKWFGKSTTSARKGGIYLNVFSKAIAVI